jgi:pilus assembly protein CpaB
MTSRIVGVLIAIVLAVAGTAAVFAYLVATKNAVAAGQEAVHVRVAKLRIPAGTTGASIRDKDLTEDVVMPKSSLPEDVLQDISIDFDKLVITADVQPRQLLLKGMFGQSTKLSGGIAVPEKMLAISGKFEVEREVGGFVRPGSTVAVFATCKILDANFKKKYEEDRMASFVLLPRMEVLAVGAYGEGGQTSTQTAEQRAKLDAAGKVTLIVTIAATQEDATSFVHATDLKCDLTLALLTDSSVVEVGKAIDNGSTLR